jgi:hypothetical protein
MTLLIYYTAIVFAFTGGSIAIGFAVENMLPWASMPVFLSLFFISLWLAWIIAVRLTQPKSQSAPAHGATGDQRA